MLGQNYPLLQQIEVLHKILRENKVLYEVIEECSKLDLPTYYIGAGCIAQTVWNYQNGNKPLTGISDIDFVYFDTDLSFEAENTMIQRVKQKFAHCPLPMDIKNQARVHLWYSERFGSAIPPYTSLESAINTWPTTATAVGVRPVNNELLVYAPYGLNDLFSQIVRPNKTQITQDIYEKKVFKWSKTWPSLSIVSW